MAEGGDGAFNFEQWCLENKIKDATKLKLQEEDIVSTEDLTGLSSSDITGLNLTVGQTNALKRAVKRLQHTTFSSDQLAESSLSCLPDSTDQTQSLSWNYTTPVKPASAGSRSAHTAVEVDDNFSSVSGIY